MFIAVSGNVGSGKTTLARYLAENYDLHFVPRERLEFNFIDEFFSDIEKNFLPAQLSFLISKAIELQKLLKNKQNIVLDRSLLEDVCVFAQLWIEHRQIDEKIVQLYQCTAGFICDALPQPDLYIFCCCPASVSKRRIASRPVRSFETKYPSNHIELLAKYYDDFRKNLTAPCVEIDTVRYDFTRKGVLPVLCTEIFEKVQQKDYYKRLSTFEASVSQGKMLPGLIFRNFDNI